MAVAFFWQSEPGMTVQAFCAEHHISRQTFYVYRKRFERSGLEGLVPQTRRPVTGRMRRPRRWSSG